MDNVFFLKKKIVEGIEYPNTAINGPSSAPPAKRHCNGVSLAGQRWPNIKCWLGSFVIFQGIRTSIAQKPLFFVILQEGGGGGSPVPPLDPLMDSGPLKRPYYIYIYMINFHFRDSDQGQIGHTHGRLVILAHLSRTAEKKPYERIPRRLKTTLE